MLITSFLRLFFSLFKAPYRDSRIIKLWAAPEPDCQAAAGSDPPALTISFSSRSEAAATAVKMDTVCLHSCCH